jgi:hypothetical protein
MIHYLNKKIIVRKHYKLILTFDCNIKFFIIYWFFIFQFINKTWLFWCWIFINLKIFLFICICKNSWTKFIYIISWTKNISCWWWYIRLSCITICICWKCFTRWNICCSKWCCFMFMSNYYWFIILKIIWIS